MARGISTKFGTQPRWSDKPRLFPYLTAWRAHVDHHSVNTTVQLAIQNKSTMAHCVTKVVLQWRTHLSLAFEPVDAPWMPAGSNTAETLSMKEVELIRLPLDIDGKRSGSGLLRFTLGEQ